MNPHIADAIRLIRDTLVWYESNHTALTPMAVNDLISLKRRFDDVANELEKFEDLPNGERVKLFFPCIEELEKAMPAWLLTELREL